MTEALLSPLFSLILENLSSHVLKKIGMHYGIKAEIETLKSSFTAIQAVLQDAGSKQWTSQAIKDWLKKLKYVAYDLDNILDEISTGALIQAMNRDRGLKQQTSALFSSRNPILFRLQMTNKVKEIKKRLDEIVREKSKFHFKQGNMVAEEVVVDSRLTSSLVNEFEIIGRDDEKEMIIEKLVNNKSGDRVAVYAIRGMGGLGKTTLSQLVYNDKRVKENFNLRIWVCVSNNFSLGKLIGAIIESIDGSHCSITELDPLQLRLQDKLKGNKFLLVLDDVWNECHENWEGLKNVLRSGAKGSMVIVTTRLESVARMMATFEVHQMGYLSEEDSWCLFKRRAFSIGGAEENSRFEVIGKDIVKKCGGLPLAIKALGSLMRLKKKDTQWLFVKENEIFELPAANGSSILPALRLSFDNLPPHSKRCFAYCGVFPKNYVMERDVLIYFWMANGFLPTRGQSDFYDVGREIFDDLVWRSFFQDVKEEKGRAECKMHDLMHDLALSIIGNECLIFDDNQSLIILEEIRHFYFSSRNTEYIPNAKSIRTLVLRPENLSECYIKYLSMCISLYKEVRYLHFQPSYNYTHMSNMIVPESIGNLIHLRCLNLSYCGMKTLPESVCCLQNLEALILRGCKHLRILPKGMKYMKSLRCLDIRGCRSLVGTPSGIGQLTHLKTLSFFIVSQDQGCQIEEIRELDLKGELSIYGLENVSNSLDNNAAILKNKKKLSSLSLYWGEGSLPENAEQILEGLESHPNLKQFFLYDYPGSRLPEWIVVGLVFENLVEIRFKNFERCNGVPSLGGLPFLKHLCFHKLSSVKSLDNSFHGDGKISFRSLETFALTKMMSLEEWKLAPATAVERQSFPRLKGIEISTCPKLSEIPLHLPRLEYLSVYGINKALVGQVMRISAIQSVHATSNLSNLNTVSHELNNLTALKTLTIGSCPSLKILRDGLKSHKFLRTLNILDCEIMEYLTEEVMHLTALRSLIIENCPKMKCLPDGLQRLYNLKWLAIGSCPYLTTRCKKDTGEDWPKISHIIQINIDGEIVQDRGHE